MFLIEPLGYNIINKVELSWVELRLTDWRRTRCAIRSAASWRDGYTIRNILLATALLNLERVWPAMQRFVSLRTHITSPSGHSWFHSSSLAYVMTLMTAAVLTGNV